MEKKMEPTTAYGGIAPLKLIEYGFGYIIIRSPYAPYYFYLRGTVGVQGLGFRDRRCGLGVGLA